MSIMSDFLALVDPILNGQAYRNVVPDSAVAPYAKFFRVSGVEGVTLDENGGDDNETATRIQIDIYGASTDVDTKTAAIKAALKSWHISNVVLLEMDGFEDEVKLHHTTLDIGTIHQ
jgi:hypothetical protein